MGTRAVLSTWTNVRAAGIDRLERLLRVLEDAEAQLSTWRRESEVSRMNAAAGGGASVLSPALCGMMRALEHWTDETGGAFDPAIGALSTAWDLHGRGRVPSQAALAAARQRSGWHRLTFDGDACTLNLPPGMSMDVGAFGKGEALDRARAGIQPAPPERERRAGVSGDASWLIDLGGQVAVSGAPPGTVGWDVSIAHPRRRDTPVLHLQLAGGSLATSAGSERDLRVGGRRIGHILDPRSGMPATFDGSVTVWHEQALAADVLSTALFVMGPDAGIQWAEARAIAALYLVPRTDGVPVSRASRAFRERFDVTF